MKRMFLFAVALSFFASGAEELSIDRVIVRQQWPWSTDVKVEYEISGVTEPVDICVEAWNGVERLDPARLNASMRGDIYNITKGGVKSFVIDPVAAFGTDDAALSDFKVKLSTVKSAGNMDEVLYRIYDLKTGDREDVTRAMLLNGEMGAVSRDYSALGESFGAEEGEFSTPFEDVLIWTGVTNDVKYKTTHLVMRKIPAKGASYLMGTNACQSLGKSSSNQSAHEVSFTNDYYMAVFELTEGQFLTLVTNSQYSIKSTMNYTNATDRYYRPYYARIAEDVAPHIIKSGGKGWPADGHAIAEDNNILKMLRTLTGDNGFDLPTEAVWEFACRAGSTNDLYIGMNRGDERLDMIARWKNNNGNLVNPDYNCTSAEGGTAIVGSYAPNVWGLYDMYGNLSEYCLDRYIGDLSPYAGDDPWGPTSSEASKEYYFRVLRGGDCTVDYNYGQYSSYRTYGNVANGGKGGVRLCLTIY
ncbi:MAG: formylglycine-generating enzyme family protein [Lentisphaerae bacterium]|nr:formylglycine-generating enzyme family protein [Lentisphaerota bacterium]